MKFDSALTYPFYDLIMIFVTASAIVWGLRAINRAYSMLKIRSAILTDRVIQIRGLGSYLSYFDGASKTHLNSVVHTRQTMPPVTMPKIYLSCTVDDMIIRKVNEHKFNIRLKVCTAKRSLLLILYNYRCENFVKIMHKIRSGLVPDLFNSLERSKGMLSGKHRSSNGRNNIEYSYFRDNGVCFGSIVCKDLFRKGINDVNLSLPDDINMHLFDKMNSAVAETNEGEGGSSVSGIELPTAL